MFSGRNQSIGCAVAWVTIARDSESEYIFHPVGQFYRVRAGHIWCQMCSSLTNLSLSVSSGSYCTSVITRSRIYSNTLVLTYYLYLRRHSLGAGWAGITNCVDHISDGGTPGSAVLRQLTRHFHPVLSPSRMAEDSRSGDRVQVGLDRGSPWLQLASSSSAPRARRCG